MADKVKHEVLELFPTRIKSRVVPAEEMTEFATAVTGIGGGWIPEQDKAYVPVADTAMARTTRLHEATHAIYSKIAPDQILDMIDQALEDVKVHRIWLEDIIGQPRRDELFFGISNLKRVAKRYKKATSEPEYLILGKPVDPALRMSMALILTRSAAIMQKNAIRSQTQDLLGRSCRMLGPECYSQVQECIKAVYLGDIKKARAEFAKYALEPSPKPKPKPAVKSAPGPAKAGSSGGSSSSGTGAKSSSNVTMVPARPGEKADIPFSPSPMPKEASSSGSKPNPKHNDFSKPEGKPEKSNETKPTRENSEKGDTGTEESNSKPSDDYISNKKSTVATDEPSRQPSGIPTPSVGGDSGGVLPKPVPEGERKTEEQSVVETKPEPKEETGPSEEEIKVKVAVIKQSDLNKILDETSVDPVAERKALEELSHRDPEDSVVVMVIPDVPPSQRTRHREYDKPSPMYIHYLNLQVPRRVTGHGGADYNATNSGMRIRAARLTSALVNTNTKLFERRNLGGTVLIDASGSMSLSDKDLMQIAEEIPLGRVAYYSGTRDVDLPGEHGDLVIYAQSGKIRSKQESLPFIHDGNLVDYAAIQWLLKQPAPRYLVSDGHFTGVTSTMAVKLAGESVRQHKLKQVCNLQDLKLAIQNKPTQPIKYYAY